MDREETEQDAAKAADKRRGRTWTERLGGSIRYRRYTDYDGGGRPSILFKFELAPGQSDLPQEVYDILHQLKYLDPSPGHGRKPHYTGLEFTRDTRHGRVWRLPDDPTGRTAADIIDAKLSDLARNMDEKQSQGR